MSFVSASDNITDDSNDGTVLSVTDDTVVEENVEEVSVDESSISDVALADDQPDVNKSVKILKKDAEVLGVSNNDPVLGAERHVSGNTVQDIVNEMFSASSGDIIFLDGKTYSGSGSRQWWQSSDLNSITVYGGSYLGDPTMAKFNNNGYTIYLSDVNLNNVRFENINASAQLFWFTGSGTLRNCVINNCISVKQFMWMAGSNGQPKTFINCNFTNLQQTYGLYHNDTEIYDGSGQLGAASGIRMENCNFINTTSGHHGGALCIADESEWGPGNIATQLINTNFINVTSRWFAVYIHGPFQTSQATIPDSQILDNCKFINCVGTGEYSGGLGISHNYVQVKNTDFINCSGGQGSAIMVGGIPRFHDGFNGQNYEANHVLIDNCNFIDNIAKDNPGTFCPLLWKELDPNEQQKPGVTYYLNKGDTIPNPNGRWYIKHGDEWFNTTGDAGAIYVIGNDTTIRDCVFNHNLAKDANGAAIYIYGQRTNVEGSEFYNHECENGTIFIEGNNATIKDSIFEENYAVSGSTIYILGSRTEISNSNFKNNNATNGTVYIKGNYTKITSGSDFIENNATYGAGVFIEGANTLISGSNFVKNNATQDGGGMYIKGDKTNITNHSNFTENHAVDGAGIFLGGTNTLISASNFVDNNATHDGAGMYVKGNNTKAISGSNFTGNHAAHDGAGMYIEGMNTLISDSYFERNNATNGAGLYIKGSNTNITEGSNFINNSAVNGAGAYLEGSNTLINGSIFEINNATYGAGLYIKGNKTNITSRSNFTENKASYGAGMYIEGSNTTISGSKFELNNATHDGGGMYIKGNNTKITSNSNFTENYADNGAGMYIEGSNTTISGSKFELNNATHDGGGMYISGSNTKITSNSKFSENYAGNGGGMYVSGSNTEISSSDFELNNATNGAGMYIKGNKTKVISGSDFTENTAVNGGGMYIEGMDTLISGSTFEKNNATNGAGMYINGNNTNTSKSNFTENIAKNGSGIYVDGSNTTISGSNFNKNNATNGAGAYIDGSNTTISGSTFEVNDAFDGAGIYVKGVGTEIKNSTFANNFAVDGAGGYINGNDTKIADSTFKVNDAVDGAGIYVEGVRTEIKNSTFTKNDAINGAGGYIDGSDTRIVDSTFEVNNATFGGAGIYVQGSRTKILNTTFYNNTAEYGAGGYINGSNTNISSDSLFKINTAEDGAGIYVEGTSTEILNTTFDENIAENGGGAYIKGSSTNILNSTFIKNNVTYHGGAVYIDGSESNFKNNNFTYNEAVPDNTGSTLSGLGGAIFVNGNNTYTFANDFEHNKARNGSAIYSSGNNFKLENDLFRENQAWSYLLITEAVPEESLQNTHDVKIEVVHIGGDNMINAIHSNASADQIGLKNVSYVHSSGANLTTNSTRFENPVQGVENSNGGKLLYQDDREYLQNLTIKVVYENDVNNPIYYNDTLLTHYFGDIYVTLPKSTLKAGKYTVTATHPEDWNYRKISNVATFRILPIVDISVNKTSDKFEYFDDDLAYWNITFYNAANSTNATNIKFDDLLPSNFEFINYTVVGTRLNNGVWTFDDGPNKGVNVTYDGVHGYGTITSLANGTNITITILSLVESDEEKLDHSHNVTSNEGSVNLDCERYTNQTSYKEFEHAVWNFTLTNTGGFTAHNVTVTHLFPIEFEFWICTNITKGTFDSGPETGRWFIPEILPGETVKLVLDTIARYDDDDLDNLVNVDYTEKHLNLTLKKTSDKDEYFADEIANFTITITNNNGCNATNVTLNDVLQPEFEYNGTYTATRGEYNSTTNKWIIPELKEGESAKLTIYSHTRIVRGNVTNTVEVSCSEGEWNYANNIAKKTVEVVPLPQPSKSVSNITPDYHGFIEYNLTIYNTGNTTYKKNLTITDTLPIGLDFIEFVGIVGADIVNQTNSTGGSVKYIIDGRKVKWIITNIENKTSAIITVKLQVNALGKLITNTSVINSIFNLANDTALIDKLIDLTNNATFMKNLLDLTGNSRFIRSIVNLTNEGATFNKLIKLVNNESYVKAIGRLTNATFENVLLNLTKNSVGINSTGNLTNNLTVTGPNGTNVTDRCSVYPVPMVDLSVNITSDKTEYYIDDLVVWTIVVSNADNATNATNVTLRDFFPSDKFELINCTLTNGTRYDISKNVWYIGDLENGTNVTFIVYSRAIAAGIAKHNVTVACNETEWNYTNNKNSRTVVVVPLPEPLKDVSDIVPHYNDVIQYNLTIINTGTGSYKNILNVTDTLPAGLLFNGTYKVTGADNISFVDDGQKLTWTITNITGRNATITLWAKVVGLGDKMINDSAFIGNLGLNTADVKYVGNLTNNLTVTGPNGTKRPTDKTVYPVPMVDLSVNKTSDKAVYFTDDIVVWTIVVSNAGNGTNATNVVLRDIIPSEFTVINGTTRNGTFNNMSNGVWNIGSLANGTNVTLKVYCLVNDLASVIDRVTNTANVTSNETDWNKTNNEDSATVKLVPLPEPIKTVNNDTPYYNDVIEFNLTIVNKGGIDYTNVLNVTDVLPVGLLFNGTYNVTGAGNISFVNDGQRLVWTLTNISKDNATITLWAKVIGLGDKMINDEAFIGNLGLNTADVKYVGNLTNMVTVTGSNGTEKSDNKTVYPVPIVDLSVNKTSDKAVYFTDDIVVWTIVVSNAGNGTNATNVILTDLIPAEFTVINGTTRNGTFNNISNGVWNIGSLLNGTNVTLKVYCLVNDLASVIDRVTNTAKVTSNETDWNKTNNEDDATVKLVPLPYPIKTVNNDTPYYNDVIEFNLTIVNEGGVNYTNILNVTDVLPAGLLFNGTYKVIGADNISFVGDNQRLVWTLTNISKDNATITLWTKVVGLGDKIIRNSTFIANNVTVDPAVKYVGNLTNVVTVTGPNGTEKSDNKTVYPVPIVDLSVNKTTDKAVYFADDVVVWTIVVHNAGNGTDATNVTLKDVFPVNEFEFISCNSSRGSTYDLAQNVWHIGDLANGTNVTLTVKSRARELGNIVNATNNVTVGSNETDWNLTNNEDNATVKVVPLPYPIKTVNNDTPYYNDVIEFNLIIVNEGGVNYTNILNVTDVLPAGLLFNGTYKVIGADNISFVGDNQRLVWILTNISKDNATITLWAKVVGLGDKIIRNSTFIANNVTVDPAVKYVGNLTNVVTVTGPNGTEKSDNKTVYPVPIVDLSVNKTTDKAVYFADDVVVWTIVVHNAGNGTDATNVTLKDVFPVNEFEFISCNSSRGSTYDLTQNVWHIGDLANGTNVTLTVKSRARELGNIVNATNNVTVGSNETDWNWTNNEDNATVKVVPLPYPIKTVNNDTPYYNDVIEFNLIIVNEGGVNYTNILNVTDVLPAGLLFNGTYKVIGADNISFVGDNQRLVWILTNISKDNATITLWAKVVGLGDNLIHDASFIGNLRLDPSIVKYIGNLTNVVTVTGPNGTEKTDNETVYPVPIVDISVNITSDRDVYFVDDPAIWTIVVSNAGNGTNATNIVLKDIFPSANFEFEMFLDSNGNPHFNIDDLDNWVIHFMENGTNLTFRIYGKAIALGVNINNTAKVSCDEKEWNYTNNNATKSVNVVVLPYPIKTVNNITPYYNDIIEYNITIVNEGGVNYTSILNVTDSLPDGLIFNGTFKIKNAVLDSFAYSPTRPSLKLTNITKDNATITLWVKVVGLGDLIYNSTFVANLTKDTAVKYVGNLTNNVTVTGPEGTEKSDNCTVYPVPIVDLSVNKTTDKAVYFADDIVVWTIVVHNAGNGTDATNVTLKDAFPINEFEFIECNSSRGITYDLTQNIWYIGNLANGTNVTLTVKSRVRELGSIVNATNNVTVSSNETDWNWTNNEDNATVKVVPLPYPVKTVNNDTPYYNGEITYTITVVNEGGVLYNNVLNVTDSLPDGLKFINATVSGAVVINQTDSTGRSVEYIVDGQKVKWILTNVSAENATINVNVRVVGLGDEITDMTVIENIVDSSDKRVINRLGNLTNNVTVTGPNGTEKTANKTVYPVPIVDVSVNITSDRNEYFIDDIAEWTIVVSNAVNGTNATNVTLNNVFPSDRFDFINCTDSRGHTYANLADILSIYIGDLANGENVTFTVYSVAKHNGTANYNVSVSCNESEWNMTNNDANKTVKVIDLPRPVKDVNNDTPYYNGEITYTITIVNEGGILYTNVLNVTDSLPDGLKFINATVSGADNISFVDGGQRLVWTLTNISKDNATIKVNVRVVGLGDEITDMNVIENIVDSSDKRVINRLGNLTNNVTVTGPNGTEKTANKTVYPVPIVDVSVNITSDEDEYFIDDISVWTIVVSNADNGTNATNVTLRNLFPKDNFDFINCTDSRGHTYTDLVDISSIYIGDLANGENVTFTVYSIAKHNGTADYKVGVSCNESEWNLTNNDANKTVNVVDLPHPEKTVNNNTPYYHGFIEFNLTIVNTGADNYTNVLTVEDTLPEGLEFNGTVKIIGADVVDQPGAIHVVVDGRDVYYVVDGQKVIWKITNMTGNSNAVIVIRAKVNALGSEITDKAVIDGIVDPNDNRVINHLGNLTNDVIVRGSNGSVGDSANCTVYPVPIVDVSVNITSDKVEYFVDDVAVWTITVHNAFNGTNASNIELSEFIPAGFDYMYCTVPDGTTFNETSRVWSIPSLANGTNITLLVHAHAKVPGDNLVNKVNVTCSEQEWNYTNNKAKVAVDIIAFHKPYKEVSNSTPYYHEYVNYTMTVENLGNFNYTSEFDVIDTLPAGLEFIKTLNITGADVIREVHDGQVVKWALTNISAKSNATIIIMVKVNGVGNLTNNLTVIGPRGATDMVNCTINPMTLVDLSVNITSDKVEYFVDDVAVWTITVHNAFNGTNASNIELTEFIPAGFDYMYCTVPDGTTFNETSRVWSIPSLANGTNITLLVHAHAKVPGDNLINNVNVSCSDNEWNYTNNKAKVAVDIIAFHKPVKVVSNSTPYYHEYVNYIMTVENLGNFNYNSEFDVIDSLPIGLEFIRTLNVTGADVIREVHDGQVVKWALTNISAKSNATIVILVKVNALGNLTNNLTVIGPRGATDMVNCTINPIPLVDISVNITSDKVEYFVDDVAVWTITVHNAANGTNASNIELSEFIPAGFDYMYCTVPDGTTFNETSHVWSIPSLANGTNITLLVHAHAKVPGDNLVNKVNVTCSEQEWNYTNNKNDVVVDIIAFHKPVKVVSNSTPYYHEYVNYIMTVENLGNFNYTSEFDVIDSLPIGLEFIRTINVTGADVIREVHDGQLVKWALTNISAKSNATIIILVKVNALGNLTNNLTVIGPRGATDMVNCTINPMPIVDLSVNITSDKDEYFVDDVATWTIVVSNAGNGTNATNVTLKDLFPSDYFEFVDCVDENGKHYNLTDDWTIPFMGNGTNMTFVVTSVAKVPKVNINNTAEVNCTEDEWNYTNNNKTKVVSIIPLPHPVKTVNNDTPYYNGEITYTITVVNEGGILYTNVLNVTDSLPDGLKFINATVSGAVVINQTDASGRSVEYIVDGQKIRWILTNVSSKNATINVNVRVVGLGDEITDMNVIENIVDSSDKRVINRIGNLTNNVTVTGPNGTEKTANKTVYPVPIVDVSVNITSDEDEYFIDDVAVWTIVVSNADNGTNATNVTLNNVFPSDRFDFINCTDSRGHTYTDLADISSIYIGDLANGENVTFTVYSVAKHNGTANYNVSVSCNESEWNLTNNDANKTVKIIDLPHPVKYVNNDTPYYNGEITYTITIVNEGGILYTNVLNVTDCLPDGLKFINATVSGAVVINQTDSTGRSVEYIVDGQKVKWILTNVSAENTTINVNVKVVGLGDEITDMNVIKGIVDSSDKRVINRLGNLTNNVTVTGPNGTEKTANKTVYPVPIVDVSVNITSDEDEYFIDDVAVWTIVVSNADNGTNATNVTLNNVFPSDKFDFINCTDSRGHTYANLADILSIYIGDLANGENVTFTVYSVAKHNGTADYKVGVSCNESEWNLTNNDANKTVNVVGLPHPEKAVNNNTPYYHGFVEFNLTIVNTGADNYTNVLTVEDTLPEGLEFNGTVRVIGADVVDQPGAIHVVVDGMDVYYVVDGQKVIWKITNMTGNSNAVIVIRAKINALGSEITDKAVIDGIVDPNDNRVINRLGNLTNDVIVKGSNGSVGDYANCTVYPVPIVDLSVNITSDKVEYFVDDVAVWIITVHNAFNGTNASNIELSELIPAGFDYMYSTVPDGTTFNETSHVWSIPSLANGTNITLLVHAHAKVPGDNLVNNVNVTCSEQEWNYTNNKDDVVVDIIAFHKPVKVVSNSTPYYHEYVNYIMTVENLGNFNYTSEFDVIDTLPAGLEFIKTLNITGADVIREVHDGQVVKWALTNISAKSNATIVILVKVNALGNLTNNLTVIGPRGATDMVNCTINPIPIVDISVNITSDKVEYFVDDVAVWTITVSNAANGTNASNIELSELLPREFEYMSCTAPDGTTFNETSHVWSIPDLANGTNITLLIYAHAKVPADDIVNKVNATCAEKEWNYTNNKNDVVVDIIAFHKPVKVVSNSTPYYHEYVNYTMTVENLGNFNYTSEFDVIDSLPIGLEFIRTINVTGADVIREVHDGQLVKWALTNISAKSNATIVIRVKVNALGNLTNNLTVIGPCGATDMVNCTINPMPIVDLSVNITSDKDEYFVDDVATWTIVVSNAGNGTNATNVTLKDLFPSDYFEFVDCVDENGKHYNLTDDWTIPFMGNGTNMTFVVTSVAKVPKVNINNTAEVNCTEDEWNYTNNNKTKVVSIISLPHPVKEASNHTPYNRDVIEYNLTVVNTGNNPYMDNLTVIDSLPDGLIFVEVVSVANATVNFFDNVGNKTIIWNLTDIPANYKAVITIKVKVVDIGNLTNNLTIIGPRGNSITVNETIYPKPIADLGAVITNNYDGSVDPCHKGDTIVWTINVTNHGPDVAVNTTLQDLLPSGCIYVSDDGEGAYDNETGVWSIGDLPVGETVTLTITTVANTTNDTIYRNVSVSSDTYDPNLDNNKDDSYLVIPPEADLVIVKLVSNDAPHKGNEITWTIVVTNNGPDTAVKVVVSEELPDGVVYVSDDSEGDYSSATGVWNVGDLTVGANATLNIVTLVNTTDDVIVNLVNTSSMTYDPNVINNYGANFTVVPPEADLQAVITNNYDGSVDPCHKGDTVVWTITVTNHGPDVAVNTTLQDLLPPGCIYVSDDGEGAYDNETGVWSIGDLPVGETVTLTITTVANTTNDTVVRNVSVSSDTYDPNLDNNKDDSYLVIPPEADLVIVKLVSNDAPHKGNEITWTIVVTNNGPDTAVKVVVSEELPDGVVYVSDDSEGDYSSATGVWNVGDLTVGANATLNIVTLVNTTDDVIVNLVNTSSMTYDPNVINNYGANFTVVPPEADLEAVITNNYEGTQDSCHKGDTIVWTINVTNHGPDVAVNTTLQDLLPEGVIYVSDDGNGAYDNVTGVWSIGDLPVGETVTLTITTVANTTNDTVVRNVSVSSDTYDPNLDNNKDDSYLVIPPEADLEAVITNNYDGSEDPCHKGDTVVWTITVTNNGPDVAVNTTLKDLLPDGVIYVDDDGNGAYDNVTGVWTIGDLPVGENVTLTITTIADATNITVSSNVSVSSDTYDPNLDNNKDDSSLVIPPEADLEIIKKVSKDAPHKGDKITWTIVVTNNGPDVAVNTVVTDKLPKGLIYVSDDSLNRYNHKTGEWIVGDIASGESVELNIVTLVDTTNKVITNLADVESQTHDPNNANNHCNKSTTVPPEADLVITVDPDVTKVVVGDKVVYTVTVENLGPDTAVNSRATVKLPKELELLGFKPSKGTYDPDTGIWTIGDLAPGEKVTLLLNTKALVSGTIIVKASVVCDTYESDLSNNNDSCEVIVEEPPIDGDKHVSLQAPQEMHATGNPIVMALLALIAIAGAGLRRKI